MVDNKSIHAIVFTDLDGTLLDDRYDLAGAAYMCNELYARGVLTIPASSKTKAELSELKALFSYDAPLISENGAGIVWPENLQSALLELGETSDPDTTITPPMSYEQICEVLETIKHGQKFEFSGFSELSVEEVAAATGLDIHGAALAKQRLASEPIIWSDESVRLADFKAQLQAKGLHLVSGGRFHHVMHPTDKGVAARRLMQVIAATWGTKLTVLACGDSPNDKPMLEAAQACALFPQRDGSYIPCTHPFSIKAKSAGALPWLEAVNELLSKVLKPPRQADFPASHP
ncbi:MAG: HAD-IIB family hydrolase [Pseudomonadaceae bacterium]|nr:HAD-IIB family hydrolase [Pseudomonadaceae bacterium]